MGEVNIHYVPAAILHTNPGINREEFINLLNEVRYIYDFKKSLADFDDPIHLEKAQPEFHGGIFELAQILELPINLKLPPNIVDNAFDYLNTNPKKKYLESLLIEPQKDNQDWISQDYYLQTGIKEKHLGEEFHKKVYFFRKPEVGDILNAFRSSTKQISKDHIKQYLRIKKVHNVDHEIENNYDKFTAEVDCEVFNYLPTYEKYESLESLIEEHPEFNPDVCIDWSKSEGTFNPPNHRINRNIRWEMKDERYYLQTERLKEREYTSIVITAEAIRKKAWALFQFHGYDLIPKFLVENPDSYEIHQKAVIDHWLSQHAIKNNMTNTELIRYRLENGFNELKIKTLSDQEALHILYYEAMDSRTRFRGRTQQPTLHDLFFDNIENDSLPIEYISEDD